MPELRRGVRVMLFASSYIPLFLILAAMSYPIQIPLYGFAVPWVTGVFLAFCIIPLPLPFLILRVRSTGTTDYEPVEEFRQRNDLVTSYLLVYVFTYLGLNYTDLVSWLSFLIFFSVVAIIQLRSEQLHVNPLLALAGYDVYEVKMERGVRLVVSKRELEEQLVPPDDSQGEPDYASAERYLEMAELGNGVYITV